jgi:hypothetical protein
MASLAKVMKVCGTAQGQEVEFHEIKIGDQMFFNHEIKLFWHFS